MGVSEAKDIVHGLGFTLVPLASSTAIDICMGPSESVRSALISMEAFSNWNFARNSLRSAR